MAKTSTPHANQTTDMMAGPETVLPLALEPRIAFDAAAGAELGDHLIDTAQDTQTDAFTHETDATDLAGALSEVATTGASEIVFIDAGVKEPAALIAATPAGAQVHFLSADSDGVAQIAAILGDRNNITAVHILSHGEAGALNLGSAVLDAGSISGTHSEALNLIGGSLSSDADILIYGCDFGDDLATITALSQATGADVAASDDVTGAASLGGDWDLEVSAGDIEAQALSATQWDGNLSQHNTGNWTTNGALVNNFSGPVTASNTTNGITTTIEIAYESGNATVEGISGVQNLENLSNTFANNAENDPSLGFIYYWDKSPADAEDPSTNDDGTFLVTIRFSEAQANPIINIDRLGGSGGDQANSSLWTLVTPDATLTKVAGVDQLEVNSTSFQRRLGDTIVNGTGAAGPDPTQNTAAGSIQVNGTFTEIQFRLSAIGVEGAGADGIEMGVIVDPAPTANADQVAIIPETPTIVDVISGGGADTDPDGDQLSITGIEDPNVPGTFIPFTANGTATLTTGTTITFGATAQDPLTVTKSSTASDTEVFSYTVSDATGNISSADVTLNADHDGDGVANIDDIDDDNDGILDADEGLISETVMYAPQGSDANALNNSSGPFSLLLPLAVPGDNALPDNGVRIVLDGTNQNKYQWALFSPPQSTAEVTIRGVDASLATPYLDIVGDLDRTFAVDFGTSAGSLSNGTDEFIYVIGVAGLGGEQGGPSYLTSSETLTVEAISDVFNTNTYSYLDGTEALPGTVGNTISTNTNASFIAQGYSFYSVASDVASIDFTLTTASRDQFGFIFGVVRISSVDTDSDGLADHLDIDSDNDGITDNVEAQTTAGYIAPSGAVGTGAFVDVNGDGLDDNYDNRTAVGLVTGATGVGLTPVDTDGDTVADFRDSDSDDDGIDDIDEAGHISTTLSGTDADRDGLDDTFDTNAGFDVNDDNISGDIGTVAGSYSHFTLADTDNDTNANEPELARQSNNAVPLTGDLDFRDGTAPPIAGDDTNSTPEDVTLDVNAGNGLLSNDVDSPSDTLTITQFQVAGNLVAVDPVNGGQAILNGIGQLTIRADGSYQFIPATNYNGAVPVVTYTVSDGNNGTDTATLSLSISAVNDAPIAQDDSFATDEDTPVTLDLLANDSDVDAGDAPGLTQIDGTAITPGVQQDIVLADGSGTVTVAANGTLTFTPATDYNGPASFVYEVTDAGGLTDTATATITINPLPEADTITLTTPEDTPLAASPLGAQDVADVASVSYTSLPLPAEGVLYYTPAGGSPTPVPTNTPLTAAEAATVEFQPTADYNGDVTDFTAVITDSSGDTANVTYDLTISAVNDAPIAQDDSFATDEDTPVTLDLLANDSDVDAGDAPGLTQIDGTAITPGVQQDIVLADGSGTVTVAANGTLTFTPAPDYNGPASFVYEVTDAGGLTDTATATITINPLPEADTITQTTPEDTPLPASPLGAQDVADVASVSYTSLPLPAEGVLYYTPAGGSPTPVPTNTPLTAAEAATVEFQPTADYNGDVTDFTAVITDSSGDTANVTYDLTISAVNDAPIAQDDSFATDEDLAVTLDPVGDGTAFDVEDGSVTITAINSQPITSGGTVAVDNGTVTLNVNGTLTFTPAPDFNGSASFSYTVTDSNGLTDTGTISGYVEPQPEDDTITAVTAEDSPVSINPLAGQTEGEIASATVNALPDPSDGVLSYTVDGGGAQPVVAGATLSPTEAATIVFSPAANTNGVVPDFTVTVVDVNNDTALVTVGINVTPVNDGPVAGDDVFLVQEDTSIILDVLDNDSDVEDPLLLTITEIDGNPVNIGDTVAVIQGSVTVNADGTLTFNPDTNYNGPALFTYTIADPDGMETTATVSGEVNPVPEVLNLHADTSEDTPIVIDPTEGMDPSDISVILSIEIGTVPNSAEGALSYTDAGGNVVPVAAGASLSLAEAQTLTFTPAANYFGEIAAPVTYTVISDDGTGGTNSVPGSYDVHVTPVNDAPVTDDETFAVDEDNSVVIDVLAGDSDVEDAGSLVVSSVNGIAVTVGDTVDVGNGSVTLNGDGTLTFTPDLDYNGPISFDYTAKDPSGAADTGTVSGYIEPLPEGGTVARVTPEETPVIANPLANETPGTIATVTLEAADLPNAATGTLSYSDAGGSVIVLNPAGADPVLTPEEAATLTFTPATNFTGALAPISFTIEDVNGDTVAGALDLEVTPVNDAPVAADIAVTVTEDIPQVIDLISGLATDVDNTEAELSVIAIDGQPISTGQTIATNHGNVTLNPDGTVTFTPSTNYFGPANFDFTISDPGGLHDSATATITVDGLPELLDESYEIAEDGSVPLHILANDDLGDPASTVTLTGIPTTAQGTLTYSDGGTVTTVDPTALPVTLTVAQAQSLVFTLAANFDGAVDPIAYTVTDVDGDSDTATTSLSVDAIPDPVDDIITTKEDTRVAIDLTANDDLADGLASVTMTQLPDPAQGVLVYQDAGGAEQNVTAGQILTPAEAATLAFIPANDSFGSAGPLTYHITDVDGDSGTGHLTINIDPTPDLLADTIAGQEATALALNLLDNDIDFGSGIGSVTIDSVPPASQGVLSYDTGAGNRVDVVAGTALTPAQAQTLIFTPTGDFNGAVDIFGYSVTDVNGDSDSTTVTLSIAAAVAAQNDLRETPENTPIALDPLANDDPGGPAATVTVLAGPAPGQGTLSYTDAGGAQQSLATGGTITTAEFTTLVFTPQIDFQGPVDPITYQIDDPGGNSDPATITLTVDGLPEAENDLIATEEDTAVALPILANDDQGDGPATVRFDTVPDAATQGVIRYTDGLGAVQSVAAGDVLSAAQAATLTFAPAADATGLVTALYTLTDQDGDVSQATTTVEINANPDLVDDVLTVDEDSDLILNLTANDDLGDGVQTLTIDNLPDPSQATLTYVDGAGARQPVVAGVSLSAAEAATLTLTPHSDYFGPIDPFSYTVTDTDGDVAQADVTITVNGLPEPVADSYSVAEDQPLRVDLAANDDLGDGPAQIALTSVPPTTQGVLSYDDGTGTIVPVDPANPPQTLTPAQIATLTFTPIQDYAGPVDPITYRITDANGDTADGSATLSIDPAPDLVDDVLFTAEDTPLLLRLTGNDDTGDTVQSLTIASLPDPALGMLTYTDDAGNVQTVVAGAALTATQAATVLFTPAADASGTVPAISYSVSDQSGDTDTAQFTIEIDAVPDAADDVITTPEQTPVTIDLLADNGAGVDDTGDGLRDITINTLPPTDAGVLSYTDGAGNVQLVNAGVALTPAQAASLIFTPQDTFNGTVPPITYTLTDLDGSSGNATLRLIVDGVPDLVDDTAVAGPGETIAVDLLANDSDFGNGIDTITLGSVPAAAEGVLRYRTNGTGALTDVVAGTPLNEAEARSLIFIPNATFFGQLGALSYEVADLDGDTDQATLSLFVNAQTDSADDDLTATENTPLDLNILDNDTVVDPASTLTLGTLPDAAQGEITYRDAAGTERVATQGTVLTLSEAATLQFIPADGVTGAVVPFDYTVTASAAGGATQETSRVMILVDPRPVAADDSYSMDEDTVLAIPVTANDDLGTGFGSLRFTNLPPAAQGVVQYIPDGTTAPVALTTADELTQSEAASLTFTPATDYAGTVTPFTYAFTDLTDPNGVSQTTTASVAIDVDAVPDPVGDAITIAEDVPTPLDLLSNDDLGDGPATLRFDTLPDAAAGVLHYRTQAGVIETVRPGASLTQDEAATLVFTPSRNFDGPIAPITYSLTDANGDTASAQLRLTIDASPDLEPDTVTVSEDGFADLDPLANDPDLGDGVATLAITAPTASQGQLSYLIDATDPNSRITLAENTTVSGLSTAQAATLRFTPVAGYTGVVDPITYTVTDGSGDQVNAQIAVSIDPAPDATDDTVLAEQGRAVVLNLTANDDLGDGLAGLRIDSLPNPAQGILQVRDGAGSRALIAGEVLSPALAATLSFTSNASFSGTVDPITYAVFDNSGDTSTAQLSLSVDPAPVTQADVSAPAQNGLPVTVDVLANDQSGDVVIAQSLQIVGTNAPGQSLIVSGEGRWSVNTTDGTITFTPQDGFNGDPTPIAYTVADDEGYRSDPTQLAVDYVPLAQDDTSAPAAPGRVTVDILANDTSGDAIDPSTVQIIGTDAPGEPLVVANQGTWSIDPTTGAITFTPLDGVTTDPAAITYTAADAQGNAITPTRLTIDYTPLTQDDVSETTRPGNAVTVDVLANDTAGDAVDPATVQIAGTDAPGQPLVVAGQGTWSIDPATGAITFTPQPFFTGAPTPISYTVADAQGNLSPATTVTAAYLPVVAVADLPEPSLPSPASTVETDGEPALAVEPIVRETADSAAPLGSITPLDAAFPILGAINSLIGLNGTHTLPTQSIEVFAGLAAAYPITMAVESVAPDVIFNQLATLHHSAFDTISGIDTALSNSVSGFLLVGRSRVLFFFADGVAAMANGEQVASGWIGGTEKSGPMRLSRLEL
ncbi:tandem-95 repeat protein, partial [Thioclava sp. SK-1]|uniref:Ig-like domain-containing protein n=1 Tax=Thioclava sp. SK-1 TaxID=1889770 RepID=UPI00114CF6E7